jgi:hypothetical protein
MTREEAIWWVNHLFEIRKEEYWNNGAVEDAKEVETAQNMAIEALQREDIFLKSMETEDDYFERTPIEKQRVCCNCRNRRTSEIVSKCMIDGHYIGYAQCFTNGCRHWASDELKWIGGGDE